MRGIKIAIAVALCLIVGFAAMPAVFAAEESGSVGLEGFIPSDPPGTPPTISIPGNGQTFTQLPITVSGLCAGDLLVKVFKNNVFAGSAQCRNGSYSLIIDLFSGQNELVARQYDALDQVSPDSNKPIVTFNAGTPATASRPTLTSNFAKRGVNPDQQLVWPVILSGGAGPYAASVEWGDGTTPDLFSLGFPGPFDIKHVYKTPGVYNIIVKVTDSNGASAYLQLVGVANGPLSQDQQDDSEGGPGAGKQTVILWQPAAVMFPLLISSFWLGRKYELNYIKKKIARGERPF
jgi:hypothetical protein